MQVRSRSHVSEIVSEVRRKMAEVKVRNYFTVPTNKCMLNSITIVSHIPLSLISQVPLRYVNVEDSLTAVDLEKKNELRKHDIETNEEVCATLLEDLAEEKRKMKAAQARKDELLKELMVDEDKKPSCDSKDGSIHPLLLEGYSVLSEKRREEVETTTSGDGRGNRPQKIKPLPRGNSLMRDLISK